MQSTKRNDAFTLVLGEAKNPVHLYNVSAYIGLTRLATLAGHLPLQLALASLTLWEARIVQSLFGRDEVTLVSPDSHAMDECNILVALSSFGKLSLYERNLEMPVDGDEVVAGMSLGPWLLDRVEDECTTEAPLEKQESLLLDEMLYDWESKGFVEERIDHLITQVDLVANVFFYIGRRIYSKSDIGSNTLVRDGLLRELKQHRVADWKASDRLCVAAMHILFSTGNLACIEEFNGRQLTATQLRRRLTQKLGVYSAMLNTPLGADLLAAPLPKLAAQIKHLSGQIDRSQWASFRRINGITLTKEEHFVRRDNSPYLPSRLLSWLRDFARQDLAIELEPAITLEQSVERLTLASLSNARQASSTNHLEQITEMLVLSAILETHADFGMSSCLRNPSRLKNTDGSQSSGVFSLAKEDFFCCTLPHPRIVETLPASLINSILYSSSQRMQFNRWHFIPGNFSRTEIPTNRHYYPPPLTSDIAEWSDLRHPGHVGASVRYAMRIPGPPLWQKPLMAFGHPYRGFYDIRLVRMQGPAFEKRDMWVANYHMMLVDVFWRATLTFVEQEKHTSPLIHAYTRDWYMAQEWGKLLSQRIQVASPPTLSTIIE